MLNRSLTVDGLPDVWAACKAGATKEHGAKRTPKQPEHKLNKDIKADSPKIKQALMGQ